MTTNTTNKKDIKFSTEFARIAEKLSASGATEKDISYILGTSVRGFRKWKKDHPEFRRALKRGKELTQAYLIAQGIKAASGYDYTEKTVKYKERKNEQGETVSIPETTEYTKHQSPDGKLLIFLVSALDRQLGKNDWMQQHKVEIDENKNLNIKISGQIISKQIDELAGKLSRKLIPSEVVDSKPLNVQD